MKPDPEMTSEPDPEAANWLRLIRRALAQTAAILAAFVLVVFVVAWARTH
jgi:hypothetical protein